LRTVSAALVPETNNQTLRCIQEVARIMTTKHNANGRGMGIHLASSTPAPPPHERRLTLGDYTADIVISKREENCCYYVIQRLGSAEIIEMARFDHPEDAEAAAEAALERWNGRNLLQRTAG
jgi:hypothetical protein